MKGAQFIKRYSPFVLSCIGAIGVATTAVLAVKQTPKAMELLKEAKEKKGEDLTKLEIIQAAGPLYIPPILMGVGTIACIFGANALNGREQAAITGAYMFLDQSYKDYKDKVIELFGEKADEEITESIVEDKYEEGCDIEPKGDTLIFYEEHHGKFFERSMIEVMDAEFLLNRKLAMEGEATVNDFLFFLGLDECKSGDSLGWSQQLICDYASPAWIDFEHELKTMDDGMECYIINYSIPPMIGYD